jgi:hypothetical protein
MGTYIDVGERHCYTDNENLIARRLFEMINMSQCLEELDGVVRVMSDKLEQVFLDIEWKNGRKKLGPIEYYNTGLCKWGARTVLLPEYDIPEDGAPVPGTKGNGDLNISRYLRKINPFLSCIIRHHMGLRVFVRSKYNICSHIHKIESLMKNDIEEISDIVHTKLGRDLGLTPSKVISGAKNDISKFLTDITDVRNKHNYYDYGYYNSFEHWFTNQHQSPKTIKVPYFTEKVVKGFEKTVRGFGPVDSDYYGNLYHVKMSDKIVAEADRISQSKDCHKMVNLNKRMLEYHNNNGCCSDCGRTDPTSTLEALKDVRDSFQEAFKDDPLAQGAGKVYGMHGMC